ncbi:T9SS type A sorting domain-containing protein [Candidatus Fermentibacteria bacterium]|nr:T9SS type A sorting domain-containing protein [Candidatus Fermentibacteria bacterium]
MRRVLHILAAFLSASAALAQAPGIVWEQIHTDIAVSRPHCARLSEEGELVVGFSSSYDVGTVRWFDLNGELLYAVDVPWFASGIRSLEVLSDGGVIATGDGMPTEASDDWGLLLCRFSPNGELLWAKAYDIPGAEDRGLDVEPLPDGGFAVCGYSETDGDKDAWVMRTDSQGDTLWSVQWGWIYNDAAVSIYYSDNGLAVLMKGRLPESGGGRPHLVRYSMDGEIEWMKYEEYKGTPIRMCEAVPEGYAMLVGKTVYRLDPLGSILWERNVPANGETWEMYTIEPVIYDGFIVAGFDDEKIEPGPDDPNSYLGRVSSSGEVMWWTSLERETACWFHDVVQLPQGGYMAVGRYGADNYFYLVRFEPETGIGEQEQPAPLLAIGSCVPNPGRGSVSIHWTSAGPGDTELTVFDISGRVVGRSGMGILAAGEHSSSWSSEGLPPGCYIVRLTCGSQSAAAKVILLN